MTFYIFIWISIKIDFNKSWQWVLYSCIFHWKGSLTIIIRNSVTGWIKQDSSRAHYDPTMTDILQKSQFTHRARSVKAETARRCRTSSYNALEAPGRATGQTTMGGCATFNEDGIISMHLSAVPWDNAHNTIHHPTALWQAQASL